MSWEQFGDGSALKRQAQREELEAENSQMAGKPTVAINKAHIGKWLGSNHDVLFGYPVNHPNERLNDKLIRTSKIVRTEAYIVETRNTIYHVMSWEDPENGA